VAAVLAQRRQAAGQLGAAAVLDHEHGVVVAAQQVGLDRVPSTSTMNGMWPRAAMMDFPESRGRRGKLQAHRRQRFKS
jgi:hypothetical protein